MTPERAASERWWTNPREKRCASCDEARSELARVTAALKDVVAYQSPHEPPYVYEEIKHTNLELRKRVTGAERALEEAREALREIMRLGPASGPGSHNVAIASRALAARDTPEFGTSAVEESERTQPRDTEGEAGS